MVSFSTNALASPAHDFFFEICSTKRNYKKIFGTILKNYDSSAKQSTAQVQLDLLWLPKFTLKIKISFKSKELEKLVRKNGSYSSDASVFLQ